MADVAQGVLAPPGHTVPGASTAGAGLNKDPQRTIEFGDDPSLPRDPDRFDAEEDSQRAFRQRFIPSGVAREVFLNVFQRLDSFQPGVTNLEQRLVAAYKAAITVADTSGDGQ